MAHQGLADLGYRAVDRPVADKPAVAAADRPAAVVGRLVAVADRPAAVAHKHAGEPQPLLVGDALPPLARAGYGLLLPVGVGQPPLVVCGQPLPAGVEPPQRGQVVVGFVLRFSDRNRGRTCSQY